MIPLKLNLPSGKVGATAHDFRGPGWGGGVEEGLRTTAGEGGLREQAGAWAPVLGSHRGVVLTPEGWAGGG